MTGELDSYLSRAARALVLLHEEKMREFLEVWRQAEAANVRLPATPDAHYQSLQHLLRHVLHSSGQYMVRMCAHLGLPDPQVEAVPEIGDVEAQAQDYLDRLLRWWRVPLAAAENADMEPERYTPGMHYWIDAMLEHAVMHPVRHSFQLRELLAAPA
ncbi:hypothetical protein GCM10010840_10750 [Deinococcus aerolatus]|uniref:DinB-like domain-containing protein n=1 Tax=Deinococcus aerolatus TaxID=522487 RepID=A0ABQ2G4H7_9DEIO|nr:hypothetical protein [Deinococcus aerolatus]GGL74487.1 hypothetical protein GCM10010840_10750 [Deinococcus aerolatus]